MERHSGLVREWRELLKNYGWMKRAIPLFEESERKRPRPGRAWHIRMLRAKVGAVERMAEQLGGRDRELITALMAEQSIRDIAIAWGVSRQTVNECRRSMIDRIVSRFCRSL